MWLWYKSNLLYSPLNEWQVSPKQIIPIYGNPTYEPIFPPSRVAFLTQTSNPLFLPFLSPTYQTIATQPTSPPSDKLHHTTHCHGWNTPSLPSDSPTMCKHVKEEEEEEKWEKDWRKTNVINFKSNYFIEGVGVVWRCLTLGGGLGVCVRKNRFDVCVRKAEWEGRRKINGFVTLIRWVWYNLVQYLFQFVLIYFMLICHSFSVGHKRSLLCHNRIEDIVRMFYKPTLLQHPLIVWHIIHLRKMNKIKSENNLTKLKWERLTKKTHSRQHPGQWDPGQIHSIGHWGPYSRLKLFGMTCWRSLLEGWPHGNICICLKGVGLLLSKAPYPISLPIFNRVSSTWRHKLSSQNA